MIWRKSMWKFKSWKGKDKYLFLISVGVMLCILAFPAERLTGMGKAKEEENMGMGEMQTEQEEAMQAAAVGKTQEEAYEKELEKRVETILSHVEGVGAVDVMIVLKTSSEKVIHVDISSSSSLQEERDSTGGIRKSGSESKEEEAVWMDQENGKTPVIEKEIYPEVAGVVISAAGGGNPTVRAEISAAMEALFGLPAHKIKVLKRVE